MEIILSKGYVLLKNIGYVPNQDLEIPVVNVKSDDKIFYRINNLPTVPANGHRIKIPKEILEHDSLYIEISIKGNSETFKSDKINLRRAVLIGDDEAEAFPASLRSIQQDIKDIKEMLFNHTTSLNDLNKRVTDLEEEGDLI